MDPKTILLVEDNITLPIGLETALVTNGFQVYHVSNGEDAVSSCEFSLPDLVVTDILLKEMDGITFLKHLSALPGG